MKAPHRSEVDIRGMNPEVREVVFLIAMWANLLTFDRSRRMVPTQDIYTSRKSKRIETPKLFCSLHSGPEADISKLKLNKIDDQPLS